MVYFNVRTKEKKSSGNFMTIIKLSIRRNLREKGRYKKIDLYSIIYKGTVLEPCNLPIHAISTM